MANNQYQYRAPIKAEGDTSGRRLYNPYQNLNFPKPTLYNLPTSPEFLFHKDSLPRRRTWSENLTYITGVGCVAGATAGAAKGFASGVGSIEPTDTLKLKINRILNGSIHARRKIGCQCGTIGFLYAGLESGMVALRDTDDVVNSLVAGLATGVLYKAAAGPRSAAVGAAIGGVAVGIALAGKQALKRFAPI